MPTLRQQFPVLFDEWEAAGGVEDNFRAYLLAIGVLPATPAEGVFMLRQGIAHLTEMANVVEKLAQQ